MPKSSFGASDLHFQKKHTSLADNRGPKNGQEMPQREQGEGFGPMWSNRARWCQTCGEVRKDGPRHWFDHPTHVTRALTSEEKTKKTETENIDDAGECVLL